MDQSSIFGLSLVFGCFNACPKAISSRKDSLARLYTYVKGSVLISNMRSCEEWFDHIYESCRGVLTIKQQSLGTRGTQLSINYSSPTFNHLRMSTTVVIGASRGIGVCVQ